MTGKQLEEKYSLLKKMLDKNLERKRFVDSIINKQMEELKEVEVLLEKVQTTRMYISHN
jgi:hypothetical protein